MWWFTPRVVAGTDLEWVSSNPDAQNYSPVTELEWLSFDDKIHKIIDTVETLEDLSAKDREYIWMNGRTKYWVKDMTTTELRDLILDLKDANLVRTKPEYFTTVCWEIMNRILWNVESVA